MKTVFSLRKNWASPENLRIILNFLLKKYVFDCSSNDIAFDIITAVMRACRSCCVFLFLFYAVLLTETSLQYIDDSDSSPSPPLDMVDGMERPTAASPPRKMPQRTKSIPAQKVFITMGDEKLR